MKLPLSIRFFLKDFIVGLYLGTLGLQIKLRKHLRDQKRSNLNIYTQGYFYQGYEDLGITGAKPTKFRFSQYEVDDILLGADIFDIGSNAGFVSCYCAKHASTVTAIEYNRFLNRIAKDSIKFLGLQNITLIEDDFATCAITGQYDVVLSLSNHHTIDGNLHMGFESYIFKVANLVRLGGYMLFESHNVFGPGLGNAGDDGDMDQKMRIINKYFTIERFRMVRSYLEHLVEDVDKLFIVAKRTNNPVNIDFDILSARECYSWSYFTK
jgi:cyclopropane fatty-acyl-phospholipid synthase-like methyltransferase